MLTIREAATRRTRVSVARQFAGKIPRGIQRVLEFRCFHLEILTARPAATKNQVIPNPGDGGTTTTGRLKMSIKKILLLASMALAAFAVAAPAGAMAEEVTGTGWTMEGVAFGGAFTEEATGKVKFNTLGSSIECEATKKLTGNTSGASSTGTVHFTIKTAGCVYGGTFTNCVIHEIEETGPDNSYTYTYHIGKTKGVAGEPRETTATNVVIKYKLREKSDTTKDCDFGNAKTILTTFPVLTTVPDNADAISTLTMSGEGTASINGGPNLKNVWSGSFTAKVPKTTGIAK